MVERLLTLREVSYRVRNLSILENISLQFHQGEWVTLVGPNGAGKSTLIKIILKLVQPTTGTLERSSSLRIGYMPQKLHLNHLLPLTVKRFLSLIPSPRYSAETVLRETGVLHLFDRSMHTLSGGEVQRVLLARALSQNPQFFILDEPTQGLDIEGQRRFYMLLQDLRSRYPKTAFLVASHDLYMVFEKSDRVVCLNHHICCTGHPEKVRQHPDYLQLFGEQASPALSVYTHKHAHQHETDIPHSQ